MTVTEMPLPRPHVSLEEGTLPQDILTQQIEALPKHTKVLGRFAVERGLQEAAEIVNDRSGEDYAFLRDRELDATRDHLRIQTPGDRRRIGKRMVKDGLPEWLKVSAGLDRPGKIVARLTEKTPDGTYAVEDATLQNILEWHNAQYNRNAERTEKETVSPMRERMITRLQSQVEKGSLPAALLPEETIDIIRNAPVHEDDGAGPDGRFRGGMIGAATAYADVERGSVVMRAIKDKASTEKTLYHELIHTITGVTSKKDSGRQQGYGLARLWTEEDVYGNNRGLDVLNEAVTEHFAHVLYRDGNIDDIELLRMHGSYNQGLMLLKALCTKGQVPISPQLFVNAMLSGDQLESKGVNNPESRDAISELREALEAAFPGKNVIERIAAFDSFALTGSISLKEVRKFIRSLK